MRLPRLGARQDADPPPQVLVVCTGNVCRSPYVTAVLRDGLPGVEVQSAGVAALVGSPPTEQVQALLRERGLALPPDDVGRQLTRRLVRPAGLIVTATRRHRVDVVRLDPTAAARAFTLKELQRLLADAPPGLGVDGVARWAHEHVDDDTDHDDDLDDPYGLDDAAYRAMAATVDAAVPTLLRALRSASS